MKFALLLLALVACPKSEQKKPVEPSNPSGANENPRDGGRQLLPAAEAGIATLPPAPALPEVPLGLPPAPAGVLEAVTPEQVAFGELLFRDPRLAKFPRTQCASCHDIANRYNGVPVPAIGSSELQSDRRDRRTPPQRTPPQLENLAWNPRAIAAFPEHFTKEMGHDLASAANAISEVPAYRAHLERIGGPRDEAVTKALVGFVLTRYDASSPWDHQERNAATSKDPVANGYRLFIGKARCGTCHTPPLYTDGRVHDTGLPTPTATRSLRGVATRTALFSDGRALTLDAALDHYTKDHPKTELVKLTLSAQERSDLLAFLGALTGVVPTAILQPLP